MSTRLSHPSSREPSEKPSRAASASSTADHKPSPSLAPTDRTTSLVGSRGFLDPTLISKGSQDDMNKHFSRFSFVPSYTNSSLGASDVGEEHTEDEDGQEISRFGSVSTSSEYPPGTSKKVKSPPPGNKAHMNGEDHEGESSKEISLPFGMQSNMFDFSENISIEDGIMVAGESERGSKLSLPIAKKITRKEMGSAREMGEAEDVTPEIVVQSPKTPTFSHVKDEPKSPRAEKALRVPFLHKFRRSESKKSAANPRTIAAVTEPQYNEPHSQEQVRSFFEAASSDGEEDNDDDKGTFIGNAQQASFRSPVLVNHSTSSSVGLKDILHRGPSARSQNISPLSAGDDSPPRRALFTTADTDEEKRESRRSGVIGWPASEHVIEAPQTAGAGNSNYNNGDDRVNGLWDVNCGPNPFATGAKAATAPAEIGRIDGLRSHPTIRSPKRQVTFPLETQVERERVWVREDVTPYPVGYTPKEEREETEELQRMERAEQKATLTVVVYAHHNQVPKVKRLSIPTIAHEIPIPAASRSAGSPAKAIMNRNFDDATLSTLLRSSYASLRGPWTAKLSARTVCSVRLLGYEKSCQLATHRAKHQCFENKDEESGFAEARLLGLYRNPKHGKGRWEWWGWVRGLPENQATKQNEKVALELVEGWSARRIILALALVAICSIVATLLWIFTGGNYVGSGIAPSPVVTAADQFASPTTIGTMKTSDGIAITASPSSKTTSMPSVPPESAIPGMASEIPAPAAGSAVGAEIRSEIEPTVMQRDATTGSTPMFTLASTSTLASTPASASAFTASDEASSPAPASSDKLGGYSLGGPGSRVGAGVALGVLVLLFGWMIVGGWIALSWMVG